MLLLLDQSAALILILILLLPSLSTKRMQGSLNTEEGKE